MTDMMSERMEVLEKNLHDAQVEIIKYQRMLEDEARDRSILYAMLEHFITRCNERHDYDGIKDALEWAQSDTGLEWDTIAEAVDRMSVCDPDMCQREYIVGVTVPVTISVHVLATNEENAEQAAIEEIDSNGLDNYYMDYDLYHSADYDVEVA